MKLVKLWGFGVDWLVSCKSYKKLTLICLLSGLVILQCTKNLSMTNGSMRSNHKIKIFTKFMYILIMVVIALKVEHP